MLTIGKLAAQTNTSANTLRFYERQGLVCPTSKGENGYRLYAEDAVKRVHFIRHAQQSGFTLAEIQELLTLQDSASACCSDVRKRAIDKKLMLEAKIKLLKAMSAELDALILNCAHEDHPVDQCPILDALSRAPQSELRS